jgi:hypothetical protein
MLGVPPLVFSGLLLLQRREQRLAADRGLRRYLEARKRARGALRRLGGKPPSREISKILREYVGDKLDVEGAALTADECERALRAREVDEGLAEQVGRCLSRLEAADYGGVDAIETVSTDEVQDLIESLEGALRRRIP